MRLLYSIILLLLCLVSNLYAQEDLELHLNAHLLQNKNIIKVKRNFNDPYLWVLAQNNEVYRINSLTKIVENFTSQFSAYQNQEFIDIAGYSSTAVFIACNSSKVLEYKNGNISVINLPIGNNGMVNSIGIDYTGRYLIEQNGNSGLGGSQAGKVLLIATNKGMYNYDYINSQILPGESSVPAKLFETTYRSEVLSNLSFGADASSVQLYNIISLTQLTIYGGFLWYGNVGSYGNDIRTAYTTNGVVIDNYPGYNPSTYMNSYWGTENGLFQNNRSYSRDATYPSKRYLEGIKVNKITSIFGMRALGTSQNAGLIKENLLVGTQQGLYYTNSGYWKFSTGPLNKYTFYQYAPLSNVVINDICVNATSYTTPVCEDGVWVATQQGLYLLKADYKKPEVAEQLFAVQYFGRPFNNGELQLCANTTVKAYVIPTAYSGVTVQWYKDGHEIPAASNIELTIAEGGDYYALLYDPCSDIKVQSNHLKVSVISAPVFTFNYPSQIQTCKGTPVVLTVNGSAAYQYRWYKNGILNGSTSNTLSVSQEGIYKVEVSACNDSWVSSSEVKVNSIELPQPVITANKASYCAGEQAVLSAGINNQPDYHIIWLVDGTAVSEYDNLSTITTNRPGKYEVLVSSNILSCSKTANAYNLLSEPLPVLSIHKVGSTPLCNGEPISLQATFSSGNIKWSTGETSSTIQVKSSGTYSAIVKTVAGCEMSQSLSLQFFQKPKLNIPDATLCQFNNQKVTLTAPAGFVKYEWNGVSGTRNYTTSALGSIHLIVTDQNGCTATETININSYCDDIRMANTFTPNGDGINDTWTITGLENDASSNVKVFNRSGSLVFESRGYAIPWNGTRNGQQLPSSSYYYVINSKNNKRVLSGTITIIY